VSLSPTVLVTNVAIVNDPLLEFFFFMSCSIKIHPNVWLDRDRPDNTCIPTSFPRNLPAHLCGTPSTKKYCFVFKNWQNLVTYLFVIKKSEKEFDKFPFCKSEFAECQIWQSQIFSKNSSHI
jgi:hypothetical protein